MIALPHMQVAVWATDSPMPIHLAPGMAATQGQSTCSNTHNLSILLSSKSNDWYTPSIYVEAARQVMGSIDLDPASCELANQTVKASRYYTKEDNGLAHEWYGNIWINPPWGGLVSSFVKRLLWEYEHHTINQAILFTNAVTDRKWFQPLWNYPICFTNGRVYCYTPGNKIGSRPVGGVCITYLGKNEQHFTEAFSQFGRIAKAIDTPKVQPINLSLWEVQHA